MSHASLYGDGLDAAEELLRDVYRLDDVAKAKARDPLDMKDFPVTSRRIGQSLHQASVKTEQAAYKSALKKLDVNWPKLTPAERQQAHRAFKEVLMNVEPKVLPRIEKVLKSQAKSLFDESRRSAIEEYGLDIAVKHDRKSEKFVQESQQNFIRYELERRLKRDAQLARKIVKSGLENELSEDEIFEKLSSRLLSTLEKRNENYFEKVGMHFANQARTYAQLEAFEEGGIQQFEFRAVIDRVTSTMCRFMNGQIFSVKRAMNRVRNIRKLRDPEAIIDYQPYLRTLKDEAGDEYIYYERGGQPQMVTQVEHRTVDDGQGGARTVPFYSDSKDAGNLADVGIMYPPLHAHCRSTVVPV